MGQYYFDIISFIIILLIVLVPGVRSAGSVKGFHFSPFLNLLIHAAHDQPSSNYMNIIIISLALVNCSDCAPLTFIHSIKQFSLFNGRHNIN